jgi:hypothetical protein
MVGCMAVTADRTPRAAGYTLGTGVIAGIALFCSFGAAPMWLGCDSTSSISRFSSDGR